MRFDPLGGDRKIGLEVGRLVCPVPMGAVASAELDVIAAVHFRVADASGTHARSAAIGDEQGCG